MKMSSRRVLLFTALMVLALSFGVFAADQVVISGFSDGEITFDVAKLQELPAVTLDVVSVNSSGTEKTYSVTGPTFADLLNEYGKTQTSLEAIRLVAGDGYSIEVPGEVLKNRQMILAYELNGEPLDEKSKPVRMIIPEERAMYWVRNLAKIEIIGVVEEISVEKINFLETIVGEVEQVDYTYYENVDQAVAVKTLVDYLQVESAPTTINLKAVDGLEKNESQEIFTAGYIKLTGKDVPLFLSPDVPKGMYVKYILYFTYGDTAVLSLAQALEGMETTTMDEHQGVPISDLAEKVGLVKGETYRLVASDGYAVEVTYDDLAKGIVYLDDKGRVRSYFQELPKNTQVKYLLTIEPVL